MEQTNHPNPAGNGTGNTYLKFQCLDYESFYESGLTKFDIEDISFFTFLENFAISGKCEKIVDKERHYYWFALDHMKKSYPWLSYEHSTWSRRLRKLVNLKLIVRHQKNGRRKDSKSFFAFGEQYFKALAYRKQRSKNTPMLKMTEGVGQFCDTPYVNSDIPPTSKMTKGKPLNSSCIVKLLDRQWFTFIITQNTPMSKMTEGVGQYCNTPYVNSDIPPMSKMTYNKVLIDHDINQYDRQILFLKTIFI